MRLKLYINVSVPVPVLDYRMPIGYQYDFGLWSILGVSSTAWTVRYWYCSSSTIVSIRGKPFFDGVRTQRLVPISYRKIDMVQADY